MNKTLISLAGPTGVGKTKVSIALAKMFNTSIISCDSRQFYKEMKIGTAVPTEKELEEVPHYFIHNRSIKEPYTVADFEKEALEKIDQLFKKTDVLIMVGGSGMYADSVMFGLDQFPEVSDEVRNQLRLFYQTHGLTGLQELLREKDPKHYARVDRNNPVRLLRALEVCIASDKPYSSFLGQTKEARNFISKMVILHRPRTLLYDKINLRVDQMVADGLVEEVKQLIPYKELSSLQTVGYKELFQHFEGQSSLEEALNEIKKNTRRYAKRQITWFKKYENAISFPADASVDEIYELLKD